MEAGAGRGGARRGDGDGSLWLHDRLGAARIALLLPHHPAAEQTEREEYDGQHDAAHRERVRHHAILWADDGDASEDRATTAVTVSRTSDDGGWDGQFPIGEYLHRARGTAGMQFPISLLYNYRPT